MAAGRIDESEKWPLKSARAAMFDSDLERYRRMSGQNEPPDTGVDYSLVVEVDTEVLYTPPLERYALVVGEGGHGGSTNGIDDASCHVMV